jgi:hypothetical protein
VSDTDAINAIITMLEATVALLQRYGIEVPGVDDLVAQVAALKTARNLP